MPRGGAREGAGRPLTGGELRKQRQLRATEEEWQIIREFSQILKKDKERAKRMLETEQETRTLRNGRPFVLRERW